MQLFDEAEQICAHFAEQSWAVLAPSEPHAAARKQDAHDDELVFHVTAVNTADNAPRHQLIDVRITEARPKRAVTRRGNLPRESVAVLKRW